MEKPSREQLRSACRDLLIHENALRYIQEMVNKDATQTIEEDSAFETAKKYIRQEGIKEGTLRFIQKLNHYASEK